MSDPTCGPGTLTPGSVRGSLTSRLLLTRTRIENPDEDEHALITRIAAHVLVLPASQRPRNTDARGCGFTPADSAAKTYGCITHSIVALRSAPSRPRRFAPPAAFRVA